MNASANDPSLPAAVPQPYNTKLRAGAAGSLKTGEAGAGTAKEETTRKKNLFFKKKYRNGLDSVVMTWQHTDTDYSALRASDHPSPTDSSNTGLPPHPSILFSNLDTVPSPFAAGNASLPLSRPPRNKSLPPSLIERHSQDGGGTRQATPSPAPKEKRTCRAKHARKVRDWPQCVPLLAWDRR